MKPVEGLTKGKNPAKSSVSYNEDEQINDDKKWEEILNEVDTNGDGVISF